MEIQGSDEKMFLSKGLRKLTERERQVIQLTFYDGFTSGEVARILNVQEGTIWSTRYRAIEKLRKFAVSAGLPCPVIDDPQILTKDTD